jgi:hypothetical protein
MNDQQWTELETEVTALLRALIPEIEDDYRASDDPEDDAPGMQVTIGVNTETGAWSYQTGDNSFTGGAYGYPVWGVGYLYRDSDPADVARDMVDDAANQCY